MTDSAGRPFDLLVVGGGINGTGIARDAAGRGLRVLLVEQDDLASHTSSSKLTQGGLPYLEHHGFRLVREALIEREVLLRAAPHLVSPLTFLLPHSPEQRPAWLIRLGLFLYDHLGGREILSGSKAVRLDDGSVYGVPLEPRYWRGFTYGDCRVDDSRLAVLNAVDARERGAEIRTRTRLVTAARTADSWRVELEDEDKGARSTVVVRALVNAAGPWVQEPIRSRLGRESRMRVRLVKGSHIVVPKLYDGEHAYSLQNDDRRIVFVIPYEDRFSLIGTTDVAYEGDPANVAISPGETDYLCRAVNRYLLRKVAPQDVIRAYADVRPLHDDKTGNVSAATRDHAFDLEGGPGQPVLLSVFGGKLTTYRKLAEHALSKLQPHLGFTKGPWTATAHLPGGDIAGARFDRFLQVTLRARPWLPESLARRLARAYGTRLERVLGTAQTLDQLGREILPGLFEAELDYLRREEWARTPEDVLWRRSKLGLHLGPEAATRLRGYFTPQSAVAAE
ncbi:glycerol-3-phosphate dehydrogenase [Benzoatithermus flavus]|uniref:Glycerol-3-phosphate dehydrogenase n=1 Tax=Benzoatithermus flavus TaxID=3108223 RepID=A0ABU8XSF1_9PROT